MQRWERRGPIPRLIGGRGGGGGPAPFPGPQRPGFVSISQPGVRQGRLLKNKSVRLFTNEGGVGTL